MLQLLSQFWDGLFLNEYADEFVALSHADHTELIRHIQARNDDAARSVMVSHVERSKKRSLAALKQVRVKNDPKTDSQGK